jgi:hypothetical protein
VAASKSRRKKKRETDQLQNQFQEVSRRKSRLEIEVKDLSRELNSLKDQILMHSGCNDEAIHYYLGRVLKQATRHDSFPYASDYRADEKEDVNPRIGMEFMSSSKSIHATCNPPGLDLSDTL